MARSNARLAQLIARMEEVLANPDRVMVQARLERLWEEMDELELLMEMHQAQQVLLPAKQVRRIAYLAERLVERLDRWAQAELGQIPARQ